MKNVNSTLNHVLCVLCSFIFLSSLTVIYSHVNIIFFIIFGFTSSMIKTIDNIISYDQIITYHNIYNFRFKS